MHAATATATAVAAAVSPPSSAETHGSSSRSAPGATRDTQRAQADAAQRGSGSARLSHMLPKTSRHASGAPPGMPPHVPFRTASIRTDAGAYAAPRDVEPGSDGSHTCNDARRRRGGGDGAELMLSDADMVGATDSDCEAEDCEYDDGELWYDAPSSQQLAQCLHDVGMDEHFRFQPSRTVDRVITPAQPAVRHPHPTLLLRPAKFRCFTDLLMQYCAPLPRSSSSPKKCKLGQNCGARVFMSSARWLSTLYEPVQQGVP